MGDIDTSASYQQLRSTSVHGWSPETNFTRIHVDDHRGGKRHQHNHTGIQSSLIPSQDGQHQSWSAEANSQIATTHQ
ncbi:hypothetical protein L917_14278 [Phytophthora nicotianae]|uniref:Uncharacterized protein n=1 Tax=Phytophthora nicotianae TaxID=4792 RepID=W2KM80_PHYNI|nr:hypothetical protein L917_14278 [Phytophthora nicotianae]